MLLLGRGGTGKSTAINSIRAQLEKGTDVVMAPTGKAATVIGGSTIFNHKYGLRLPLKDDKFDSLPQDDKLLEMQERWVPVRIVFIDEFSMLSQKHLYWIDHRLRQIKHCNLQFGGLIVVLLGDTGQLPPVGGHCLWSEKHTQNKYDLEGRCLYRKHFKTVVILTENKRIANDVDAKRYESMLIRLRDDKTTGEDVSWIQHTCHIENMSEDERQERGFDDDSITFLCNNARVVLEMNLAPELGLANGCTGTVKEIVYGDSQKAPNLPLYCWVEIDEYTGPTFFKNNPARCKWVPIFPQTVTDFLYSQGKYVSIARIMLPIRLAWAWTIWKAQGQTYKGKVIIQLGKQEQSHGLTYVAFSRSQRLKDIGIIGGVYKDRLTTTISKKVSLKDRLVEDERLLQLSRKTQTLYEEIEHQKRMSTPESFSSGPPPSGRS